MQSIDIKAKKTSAGRRRYLKTVGAIAAGLVIGGAAGWLSRNQPREKTIERITETVTKTVTIARTSTPSTPSPTSTSSPTSDNNETEIILLPSDVNADPGAYEGYTIKVEGVVIQSDVTNELFHIMPIDIYLGCGRNAYCGEEYTHLPIYCDSCQQGCPIPSFEHHVIVTGIVKKTTDGKYRFQGLSLIDKGQI